MQNSPHFSELTARRIGDRKPFWDVFLYTDIKS